MRSIALLLSSAAAAGVALPASAAADAAVSLKMLPSTSAATDYAHARAMPLPAAQGAAKPGPSGQGASMRRGGSPGHEAGRAGSGVAAPELLFTGKADRGPHTSGVGTEQVGLQNQPFTTSRANIESMKGKLAYPFTAVGRLFFDIGSATYVCSASLIKPGVVVTAAHCVSQFGANTYYTNFKYVPAYSNGVAPYGVWVPQGVAAPTKYLNGTTTCASFAPGVVCEDDMAVMVLTPKNGRYPGETTGYLGFGWDGDGFNDANLALLTQFGYPVDSDGGEIMQRTDSQAFVDPDSAGNTLLGSEQRGGSSGGPWVADWGIAAKVPKSLKPQPVHNLVVGVTSWGYTDPRYKQQGAAPFLSSNIVPLVTAACTAVPAACATTP